ncbi:penicillin acylase family protein [Solimonas marina]|uniref:Acyl-homoserine-lactone acylase n=1 Tax=Solimonas marina TaxID=2714601 RepID=A0A969W598_9GAMM|nr:penicillin acylase family protein [Solimonas marina]NKF20727.1 hypothetical protein [Solimonas marina]
MKDQARSAWALVLLLLAACSGSNSPNADGGATTGGDGAPGGSTYDVTVTRTEMGIPHIKAADWGSLGYGYGYAFAEDNLCVFLDDLVTIRGERSRYFGPDGSYSIPAVPVTANNVDSDFFWKLMATDDVVAQLKASARDEVRQITTGYVAGFNRYIRELQAGEHPGRHATCADAGYLQPITEDDMYRRYFRLSIIASSSVFTNEIAQATPPLLSPADASSSASTDDVAEPDTAAARAALLAHPGPFAAFGPDKRLGSNMYGLGPDATQTGQSMLFGNPHFPWTGTERLYIVHLEVPGKMNIMGASLYGVPLVLIGFNDKLAWSHTVSTAYRFTLYELPVNPLNAKQYFYDGQLTDVTPVPLTIDVKQDDGSIAQQSRTLYRTQYGPVLELTISGIPVLGWDNLRMYTLRDANAENDRLMNQFFAWDTAPDLTTFKADHASILGVPWVNTVATGPGQDAYYGDLSVVPNVPDDLVSRCKAPLLSPVIASVAPGLPLLLGNRTDCQWLNDADAPAGIFGAEHLPTLERSDWVANMNDSYWLTNPAEPLTGYARIIGDEATARTLRTRLGIRQIQQRLDGSDGLAGTKFSYDDLKQIVLGSRIYSAELAQADVLADLCGGSGTDEVCAALANWNGTANLDATGTQSWIEFWQRVKGLSNLWNTPFSADDPVNTPNTLNTANRQVAQALSDAQTALDEAGIAADAPFGSVQHSGVHGDNGPSIFGSEGTIGAFTVADSEGLTDQGYLVDFGNSYIQAVTWENGAVHAEGFITYSESTDPANPHYVDYTERYSAKNWLRFPFTDSQISADAQSTVELSE